MLKKFFNIMKYGKLFNNEIFYFVDIRIFQKPSLRPVIYYDNSYSTNTLESNLIFQPFI